LRNIGLNIADASHQEFADAFSPASIANAERLIADRMLPDIITRAMSIVERAWPHKGRTVY
jgi:hypothetical protein